MSGGRVYPSLVPKLCLEPKPRNSVSRPCLGLAAKQRFAEVLSQTEFGNEENRVFTRPARQANQSNPALRSLLFAFWATLVRGERLITRCNTSPPNFFSAPSRSAK